MPVSSNSAKPLTFSDEKSLPESSSLRQFAMRLVQGMLIGLGAVLPGVSGGVLSVVFGIYRPIMELLCHPLQAMARYKNLLIPVVIGGVLGFLGVSNILSFFLNRYPDPSVCVFIGLIAGMIPGLFKEADKKGKHKGDMASLLAGFGGILGILLLLQAVSFEAVQNLFAWLFCGFCAALSLIVPGMSFSTFLMPMHLYTPFIAAIGHLDFGVIVPAGAAAVVTAVLLSRAVNRLFERYYSQAFHAIIGITLAATLMIVPFSSFASIGGFLLNGFCLLAGGILGYLLDRWNQKNTPEDEAF